MKMRNRREYKADAAERAAGSVSKKRRMDVSVSAMLVSIHQKNIAQAFILERYFFVSIYPAVIPGTYLMVFLVVALLLCLLHQIYK